MTVDVARPARPAQVTVAFWLLLAGAALLLGIVGVAIAHAVHFDGQISRAAAAVPGASAAEVRGERDTNLATTLFVAVPALLVAVWLAVAALPVLRGSNVARIFVFVAGGGQLLLALLQSCGGLLMLPLAFAVGGGDSGGDVIVEDGVSWEDSDFFDALYSEPDLFSEIFFMTAFLSALVVLALTCAVVLMLALPPAHRYFVPRAAAPPPAPAWPTYPGGVPVQYLICPDPSAHFRPAPAAQEPAPAATEPAPAPAAAAAAAAKPAPATQEPAPESAQGTPEQT